MSKHVAPHRWADALAGKLTDAERAVIDAHAAECARCARAKARVRTASDSFVAIRTRTAPEIGWDAVRAKVHWTVSTERRAKVPPPRPWIPWIAVGTVATAGMVAAVVVDRPSSPTQAVVPDHPTAPQTPRWEPARPTPHAALVGLVNRTTGDVMLDGIRPSDVFDRRLGVGTKIATANGEVDVQFGTASAFRLGPHSTLELRRFDAQAIELVIEGRLDLQVAPRTAGQRFVVHAGDRAIEVRGTQFRVEHVANATTVACRHGLVAVSDRGGPIEVASSRRLEIANTSGLTKGREAKPLSIDELATLEDATPITLPIWDLATLASSAPLEIATPGRRDVRLDGIDLGAAPLRVRVMPGRHTVEAADPQGRFRRAGWVDVSASTFTRLEVRPEAPPTRGIEERKRQLRAGIDKPRLDACTRKLRKQNLSGTHVQIEIGVDAQGAVNFLNILDHDTTSATAQCIRDVLAATPFKPGVAASWRERIDL